MCHKNRIEIKRESREVELADGLSPLYQAAHETSTE